MWMDFQSSSRKQRAWQMALLLAVTTLLSLGPGLTAGLYQQEKELLRDPFIMAKGVGRSPLSPFMGQKGTAGLDHYRPLSVGVLRWNYALQGESPFSFRLVNWLFHWATAFLVYQVIYLWSGGFLVASFTSLFFALHPAAICSVLFLPGRDETMFVLLGMLAWYFHLRSAAQSGQSHLPQRQWAVPIILLAALLSHEKAVLFIPLMLLGDYLKPRLQGTANRWSTWKKEIKQGRWLDYSLLGAVFIVYALWKYIGMGVRPNALTGRVETLDNPLLDQGFFISLASGLKLSGMYLLQMLSPFRPRGDLYDFFPAVSPADPGLLASVALWSAMVIFGIWFWARRTEKGFFLWGILLSLLPALNWFGPTPQVFSIRYTYFPLVWLALGLAEVISHGPDQKVRSNAFIWIGRTLLLSFLALNIFYSWERRTEIGWLKSINRSDPSCLKAAVHLSDLSFQEKGETGSIAYIETAAKANPDFPLAQSELARALANTGRLDEALKVLEKARSFSPAMIDPYLIEGNILEMQKKLNEASAVYEAGLKIQPRSVRALIAMGSAHAALEQHEQALANFRRAVMLNPGSSIAWLNIGIVEQNQQHPNDALAFFEKALRMEPSLLLAYLKLGDLYSLIGNTDASIMTFKQAQELYPDSAVLFQRLGEVYLQTKRFDDAAKTYHQASLIFPKMIEMVLGLANTYREAEDYAHAEEQYQKALQLDPQYLDTHMALGLMYYRQQNHGKAIEAYRKVIELNPKSATPYFNIGNIYLATKQAAMAVESYKKALELAPELPQPHYNMGKAYEEMKNYEEAIRAYEQFIRLWKGERGLIQNLQQRIQEMRGQAGSAGKPKI